MYYVIIHYNPQIFCTTSISFISKINAMHKYIFVYVNMYIYIHKYIIDDFLCIEYNWIIYIYLIYTYSI